MTTGTNARASLLPYSRVYFDVEELFDKDGLVEFILLYEGELLASANGSSHVKHKHEIRRVLHAQLRRQWQVHPGLRHHALHSDTSPVPSATEQERVDAGIATIGKNWNRAGYNFVPLVTGEYPVKCGIDIQLLRPGDHQYISRQGDLDGQLKTLFDAFRIPANENESGRSIPREDENPFFCLLADDKLVISLRVVAEELLLLPHARELKATDAFAVIHVTINAKMLGGLDNYW